MLKAEREEKVKKIYEKLELIYEERMSHVRTLQENHIMPADFVNGFIMDPVTGQKAYQYFDEGLGIIRLITLDEALYFIIGVIVAYVSATI